MGVNGKLMYALLSSKSFCHEELGYEELSHNVTIPFLYALSIGVSFSNFHSAHSIDFQSTMIMMIFFNFFFKSLNL